MRNTIKTAIILFILLTQFIFFSSAFAQTPEITNGINYLITTQNPDGSFGDETVDVNMPFYSTTEAVNTFKVLQETGTLTYTNAVQWLGSYPADNEGYIAWRMSALSGGNIDLSSDLTLLLQWQNTDKGWGGYDDYLSSSFHTALALQALKAINYSDLNLIGYAIGYLTSTQNTDGGFGFYKGDESNVYMTALVSYTLQQFSQTLSLATAINKATTYLIAHQNTDGGFGQGGGTPPLQSASTVFETAYAYMALTNQITDNTVLGNAVNYLKTTQLTDGSWNNDPYSTALALRAIYMAENRQVPVVPPPAPTTGTTFSNPLPVYSHYGNEIIDYEKEQKTLISESLILQAIPENKTRWYSFC